MAVALPALVVVLFLALTAVVAVTAQLRCVDAAREGARAVARGDPPAQARAVASHAAPAGSTVVLSAGRALITVTVRARTRPLGPRLPGFAVSGRAVTAVEPVGAP